MARVINNAEDGKVIAYSVSYFVSSSMYDFVRDPYGKPVTIEAKIERHNDVLGRLVELLHEKGILSDDEVFKDIIGLSRHQLTIVPD